MSSAPQVCFVHLFWGFLVLGLVCLLFFFFFLVRRAVDLQPVQPYLGGGWWLIGIRWIHCHVVLFRKKKKRSFNFKEKKVVLGKTADWPSPGFQFSLIRSRYWEQLVCNPGGRWAAEAQELLSQQWEGLKRALEAYGAELLLPYAPGTDVCAGSCVGCDLSGSY